MKVGEAKEHVGEEATKEAVEMMVSPKITGASVTWKEVGAEDERIGSATQVSALVTTTGSSGREGEEKVGLQVGGGGDDGWSSNKGYLDDPLDRHPREHRRYSRQNRRESGGC